MAAKTIGANPITAAKTEWSDSGIVP